jgi:putative transposase
MHHEERTLTQLTEDEREKALQRYRLLRPALEDGVPGATIAQATGMSERTVRRWIQGYKRDGLPGLVRAKRSDRGARRQVSAEVQQLIEGLALQKPPPTAAAIHRRVAALAAQKGWRIPSYPLVTEVIRNLPPAVVTLAHEGTKQYKETYDLIHRREATRPDEIWQADHSPLKIYLMNEEGQPARPWVTVILDDYSRAVMGYFLTFKSPSTANTALTLRQAIWRKSDARWPVCGIPGTFYTDHGSDFTTRHMEQVGADLKMSLVFSIAGEPRGRGRIERFFQTITQLLLCDLPGYAPRKTSVPPTSTKLLTMPEFERRFHEFLMTEYHHRVHSVTGMAPLARWEAGGFIPQMPESVEQLDLLLLTVAQSRKVRQDGIHFQGLRYLDLTLAAYVGEDVTIRYDPRDMAEIRVFHQDKFICRALCQELAGETIGIKEIISARNHRRRDLRAELATRKRVVDSLTAARRGDAPENDPQPPETPATKPSKLRRYFNE